MPSLGVTVTASLGSSSLDISFSLDSSIGCGLIASISGLCGNDFSCSGIQTSGIGSCEQDPPGGLPTTPEPETTQAPATTPAPADEEPPVDDGSVGLISGPTVRGYDDDGYTTYNPGVYDVTRITPTENSTNDNAVRTQIVAESCPGNVACRQITQVAIEEGSTM